MRTKFLGLALMGILLSSCGGGKNKSTSSSDNSPRLSMSDQLMMSTLWMQQSKEAKFIQKQTFTMATEKLKQNLLSSRNPKPPALIIDIDETVLDNSPYEARLILSGKSFDSESWGKWVEQADADLIPGADEFLKNASNMGVQVFYISNRSEGALEATIQNLNQYGLPFTDIEHVLLKQGKSSSKTDRREGIRERFNVILLVGDQMTDFTEEPFMEEDDLAEGFSNPLLDSAAVHFVLLPNPMYGSFESGLYRNKNELSQAVKNQYRRDALDPRNDMQR